MINPRMVRGLPRHFEKAPLWGINKKFPWRHDLPGKSVGGIQYIPSLGLMGMTTSTGNIQFRDPVTVEVLIEFIATLSTDGIQNFSYAPSANVICVPFYENSGGNRIALWDLNTGEVVVITSLSAGTYDSAYVPTKDKFYVTAWQGNIVYEIDPWTKTQTGSISGLSGITLGIAYSPVNDRLYAISRSANTAQRINPSTLAVDNTVALGGGFDLAFFSDNMSKVVVLSAASGIGAKTIDPLAADAVASLTASAATGFSGCSIPKTGETCVEYSDLLRFYDQSGTNTTNLTVAVNSAKFVGWNPITETIWITDGSARILWIIDPVTKTVFQQHAILRTV